MGKVIRETLISLDGLFTITRDYDYDQYGRVSLVDVTNHLGLSTSYVYDEIDIMDNVRRMTYNHKAFNDDFAISYAYDYDHGSRLLSTEILGMPYVGGNHIIEEFEYDGRSRVKLLHQGVQADGSALQDISYGYHNLGWLESIGDKDAVARKYITIDPGPEDPTINTGNGWIEISDILNPCPDRHTVDYTFSMPAQGTNEQTSQSVFGNYGTKPKNCCTAQSQLPILMQQYLQYIQGQGMAWTQTDQCNIEVTFPEGFTLVVDFCDGGIEIVYQCLITNDRDGPTGCDFDVIENFINIAFDHIIQFLGFATLGDECNKAIWNKLNDPIFLIDILSAVKDQHDKKLPPPRFLPGTNLFALNLYFDKENQALRGQSEQTATARYNGDVSWMEWVSVIGGGQFYGFEYDELNRLTRANYSNTGVFAPEENQYGTTYDYADRRGNIEWIKRKGMRGIVQGAPEYSTIDSIRFTYDPSNLIQSVFELSDPNIGYRAASGSYGYENGNVISDPSHRISNIEYNILNLPQKIYSEKGTIDISYDGDGNVLRKKIVSNADTLPNDKLEMLSAIEDWRGNAKSRSCKASGVVDYVDGFIYIDGVFQSFAHSQGRVNVGDIGTFNEYFISDHLGNTRVIYADLDASGTIDVNENICEVLEEYHYYPFGEEMTGLWTPDEEHLGHSKYRYNGKEKQTELDWGWYNYGGRYYDPQIARFTGVDPIAEQYAWVSPYNYAENSPITYIDLWGLQKAKFVPAAQRPKVYDSGYSEWVQNNPNVIIRQTLAERAYLAGKWLTYSMPTAKLMTTAGAADELISGFSKSESNVLRSAENILGSDAFKAGVEGMKNGKNSEAVIDGIPIIFQADGPFSGMTLFQEGGFVIGKEALKTSDDISITVLHETFRLGTSSAKNGNTVVSQGVITNETADVVKFLEKAIKWLKQ